MANRQSPPAAVRADARENTARAVMHKSALPGWFWGMLGCLTVLGVGFGVLIVVARNGLLDGSAVRPSTSTSTSTSTVPSTVTASAAAPTAPAPATGLAGSGPRPQIEQLVPPPSTPVIPAAEPKPKMQPHAIKLARSPSGGHPAAVEKPADDKPGAGKSAAEKPAAEKPADDKPGAGKSAAASDEAAPAKKASEKSAGDDDQVVRHHKPTASDEDDDEEN